SRSVCAQLSARRYRSPSPRIKVKMQTLCHSATVSRHGGRALGDPWSLLRGKPRSDTASCVGHWQGLSTRGDATPRHQRAKEKNRRWSWVREAAHWALAPRWPPSKREHICCEGRTSWTASILM